MKDRIKKQHTGNPSERILQNPGNRLSPDGHHPSSGRVRER